MQSTKNRRRRVSAAVWWGRFTCALVMLSAVLGMLAYPVQAQTYRFQVAKSTTDLTVNADGTVSLDYDYVFNNDASADAIDAIDVGVPTSNYDLSSASGSVNGNVVTDITESPYVKPGIALNLHGLAIPPGQSGEVLVHIGVVRGLLFKGSAKESEPYASFHFNPNYFGSDFVRGSTNMTVTIHLPPGLKDTEPRYISPSSWPGDSTPQSGIDDQNRVFYTWKAANASASTAYDFGATFPARVVPDSAILTPNPLGGLSTISLDSLCPWIFCLGFAGFIGLTIYGSIVGDRKRKLQYLPPKLSVEGNGIKRGLTAVEAGVLMEQPLDKILTMILFSVIKKDAASVVQKDPMKLQVATPAPDGLQTYETQFLTAMSAPVSATQRTGLQNMMTDLVKSVAEKMRGFSRKETLAYYQDIMNRAWQQVEAANTPDMKMQSFDQNMDWTMLDRNFTGRTQTAFGPQPVFLPIWWGRYDPAYRGMGAGGAAPSVPSVSTGGNRPPSGVNLPSLPGGQFASSMTTGIQSFSSSVVGNLTAFTGAITSKTNPPPPPSASGRAGGGGGGHSCACACACAGCACACAGGGR